MCRGTNATFLLVRTMHLPELLAATQFPAGINLLLGYSIGSQAEDALPRLSLHICHA